MSFRIKSSNFFLLSAILLFSKCSKDPQMEENPALVEIQSGTVSAATASTLLLPPTQVNVLDVSGAIKQGNSYQLYNLNLEVDGDSDLNRSKSTIRIFENGVELGPSHSRHTEIVSDGKGRFSHWRSDLYFSSSDNTDPRINGRKYTYVISSDPVSQPTNNTDTSAEPLALSNLIGYANVSGKTTGGQGGAIVTVSSFSTLKRAVESNTPMTIKVSGRLFGMGSISVKSNKSIIGLKGATCEGFGFRIYNASNVIIQNLTIKNVININDDDCINIKSSHHIWVDHCDLSANRSVLNWEYYDGLIDISHRSNYITLSWNKLHDSYKPVLIGADDGDVEDIGHSKVSLYKNYFYNATERQPRVRFGTVHVFNNYIRNVNGYGILSSMGAIVDVEKNFFEKVSTPIRTDAGAKPGYLSNINTNRFVNSGPNRITTPASSWTPSSIYAYSSSVIPVDQVPSVVQAGAGPK
ncbi:pectate lyase family protein [Desertivirga arenae]|uniref:pectate lyase family protein n=1 Tax=Desertivirga arenae TaxID=2810309 RepID=UPI001A9568BC|nr:pectate lyase [Pedobacter sp. SYSU D00823]